MTKNTKMFVLPLLLAAAVFVGVLFGVYFGRNVAVKQLRGVVQRALMPTNKLSQTIAFIESSYVDSICMDSLAEHIIPQLMKELDPHSVYIPASETAEHNEPLEGEFDGIGVVFNMATDTVIVLNVMHGGPSDRAGIKSGDRIIEVNDTLIAGVKMPQWKVMKRLRGKRGTKVMLSVERQGIDDLVDIEVTRDAIPIKSIESSFRVQGTTGYIKLGQFARTSHVELLKALAELRAEGVDRLVFDLRGNTGGFLDQAILIANEFLHKGQLIVYTENRFKQQFREYATGDGTAQDMAVVVLIDQGSASSSEILSGALQDNDRGTIIGRRSFGKGLVQTQISYRDGSALLLTTARYFTPTGRCIQKPYTIGDDKSYEEDIINRLRNNEFFTTDSLHFADSLKHVTPKGKVVYGGGGIMPDIFVPADTTDVTRYFVEVVGRNILYRYTIEYADRHREALNAIHTLEQMDEFFDREKHLLEDFVQYAARHGVAPRRADIRRSGRLITAQLRAFIARNTDFEENGFYENIFPVDNVMQKALQVLDTVKVAPLQPVDAGRKEQK